MGIALFLVTRHHRGTRTGGLPDWYWGLPPNTTMVETPFWNPAYCCKKGTGRWAPRRNAHTGGTPRCASGGSVPEGRNTRPWPLLSRAASSAVWMAAVSSPAVGAALDRDGRGFSGANR